MLPLGQLPWPQVNAFCAVHVNGGGGPTTAGAQISVALKRETERVPNWSVTSVSEISARGHFTL